MISKYCPRCYRLLDIDGFYKTTYKLSYWDYTIWPLEHERGECMPR